MTPVFNQMLIPTVVLAAGMFALGMAWARRLQPGQRLVPTLLSVLLAAPSVLLGACYLHTWFENSAAYCSWRAMPGMELTAGLAALPLGLLFGFSRRSLPLGFLAIALSILACLPPYVKPLLFPLDTSLVCGRWTDGICLQSSSSTCGPAVTATFLAAGGIPVTEKELAAECHSCSLGTENWYLARALERRGMSVGYQMAGEVPSTVPFPSIAGLRLLSIHGVGHYIAILGKEGDRYIVGEPLRGRLILDRAGLERRYWFTGFFLLIRPSSPPPDASSASIVTVAPSPRNLAATFQL